MARRRARSGLASHDFPGNIRSVKVLFLVRGSWFGPIDLDDLLVADAGERNRLYTAAPGGTDEERGDEQSRVSGREDYMHQAASPGRQRCRAVVALEEVEVILSPNADGALKIQRRAAGVGHHDFFRVAVSAGFLPIK